jgi:hypothetical protein
LRARVEELMSRPSHQSSQLARLLERSSLRFRTTTVADGPTRHRILEKIRTSSRIREEAHVPSVAP